jgi:hypothetical protein
VLAPQNKSCAGFEETDGPTGNTSPSTDSPPLAQIEDALDQLLTHLLKEREQERKKRAASGQPPSYRVFSCAELLSEPIKSDEEIWREIIIEHPKERLMAVRRS